MPDDCLDIIGKKIEVGSDRISLALVCKEFQKRMLEKHSWNSIRLVFKASGLGDEAKWRALRTLLKRTGTAYIDIFGVKMTVSFRDFSGDRTFGRLFVELAGFKGNLVLRFTDAPWDLCIDDAYKADFPVTVTTIHSEFKLRAGTFGCTSLSLENGYVTQIVCNVYEGGIDLPPLRLEKARRLTFRIHHRGDHSSPTDPVVDLSHVPADCAVTLDIKGGVSRMALQASVTTWVGLQDLELWYRDVEAPDEMLDVLYSMKDIRRLRIHWDVGGVNVDYVKIYPRRWPCLDRLEVSGLVRIVDGDAVVDSAGQLMIWRKG